MIVVPAEGEAWLRSVELRVEDHPDPVGELERLHALALAYRLADRADALAGDGDHAGAAALYQEAGELAPDSDELLFWSGLAAAQAGDLDRALERVHRAIEISPGWAELLARLPEEIAPGAGAVRAALGDAGRSG
jgi:tetratricopeptide (TPR) repeat protein